MSSWWQDFSTPGLCQPPFCQPDSAASSSGAQLHHEKDISGQRTVSLCRDVHMKHGTGRPLGQLLLRQPRLW